MTIILPFHHVFGECLSIGPSQGIVYAIDEEIVLKLPFQYQVSKDTAMSHCWDLSVRSFVAMEREMAIYNALQARSHPNFAQMLGPHSPDYLFLERLKPLNQVWSIAGREDHHRWVLELLAATSWLEKLGFVNGDFAVRNLGVDKANTLKVFDFGSSSRSQFPSDVLKDHFDLATCLHFILSGVDPFSGVHSHAEAVRIRDTLEAGQWTIAEGAEALSDIIQDGWTGRSSSRSFSDLLDHVTAALSTSSPPLDSKPAEKEYHHLQLRCQDWLRHTPRNPLWKKPDEYIAACKDVGHELNLDDWR